ncbi:MAG: hypothetical protein JWM96_167 [Alphaproteobacteria bacterium]|nr:hypothetical protein [Alphaproteobacteria bacterium]
MLARIVSVFQGTLIMLPNLRPFHILAITLCVTGVFAPFPAFAEDEENIPVVVVTNPAQSYYSYRKTSNDKTLAVMLYGFKDQPGNDSIIPKDRKALSAFFHQHLDHVNNNLNGDPDQSVKFVTGGAAFNSTQLNRGPDLQAAKMVGLTVPMGKLTFGGGYTWGEKNPAMMRLTKAEGFFAGASYDTGRTGFQVSYLSSGQEIMGLEVGGTDIRYDSLMFGTSFRVSKRVGLTATLQFRSDEDQLTTGDHQAIATVGTKWKF